MSWAADRTASKSQPGLSVSRFSLALAALTKEMPTFAWRTWLAVVSKVRKTEFGPGCPVSRITFEAVNGWSKAMSK